MSELRWTGERVVPGDMHGSINTFVEHLQRYVFALSFLTGDDSVVDAACGAGYGSLLLAMAASRVVGLDVSEGAVEFARDRFRWPGLSFARADLDEFDFPEDSDVVVSFETVEHLRDPDAFVERIAASLRPGGTFIVSVPRELANDFHLHLYDWDAARELIEPRFQSVTWFGQRELESGGTRIPGLSLGQEDVANAQYFVAVCRKAE